MKIRRARKILDNAYSGRAWYRASTFRRADARFKKSLTEEERYFYER